jgi:hypothetical protein
MSRIPCTAEYELLRLHDNQLRAGFDSFNLLKASSHCRGCGDDAERRGFIAEKKIPYRG